MKKKKILFFYSGSIGDTLVFLPVINEIMERFRDDEVYLYNITTSNSTFHKHFFDNQLVFKKAYFRKPEIGISSTSIKKRIKHFFEIFSVGFDYGFFLILPEMPLFEKIVFKFFLRIKKTFFFKMTLSGTTIEDALMKQINQWKICKKNTCSQWLIFTNEEKKRAQMAFEQMQIQKGQNPIAVGIGGKKEACLWPLDRYMDILSYGVKKYNFFPIFYGGSSDRENADKIIKKLGTGLFSLSSPLQHLTLREQTVSMSFCLFYLGNDTGTMHMANVAGIPCLVLFSDRSLFRNWYPHGENNICLIHRQQCEACNENKCHLGILSKCMGEISCDEVKKAIDQMVLNITKNVKKESNVFLM